MLRIPEEYIGLDKLLKDGRITEPSVNNRNKVYDLHDMLDYCAKKGIDANQLSDEEIKMYIK